MCPHAFNNPSLSSWDLMITLGIIAAAALFILLSVALRIPAEVYLKHLAMLLASSAVGFASGVGFQALYDLLAYGPDVIADKWTAGGGCNIGITFMGGLIGGAAAYFLLALITKEIKKDYFTKILAVTLASVTLAHALGRIGCFMAGCCYGVENDALGVEFASGASVGRKVLPTQLYEAGALAALLAAELFFLLKKKAYALCVLVYLYGYGIARFIIEFFRGDYRGGLSFFLSPSQVLCVLLIGLAAFLTFRLRKKE